MDDSLLSAGITAVIDPHVDAVVHWEQQWRLLGPFVDPYQPDRGVYRSRGVNRAQQVQLQRHVWDHYVASQHVRGTMDGFLLLGLVPVQDDLLSTSMELDDSREVGVTTPPAALSAAAAGAVLPPGPLSGSVSPQHLRRPSSAFSQGSNGTGTGASVTITLRIVNTDTKQVSFDDSVDDPMASDRVKDLESEVRELTRQLRIMRVRDAPSNGESPCPTPPQPQIVNTKPLVAASTGNSVICLNVNYLDPDMAPFVVAVGGTGDRQLVPCTVLEHKYIIFVAPAHNSGSVPVTLLGTSGNGGLKRYTRSTWLEYKFPEASTLSFHAVNQLGAEIPLPSSTTGPDASEYTTNVTEGKSEADMTENDAEIASDVASDTVSVATAPTEDHPKLTREMLEMLGVGRGTSLVPPVSGHPGTSSPTLGRSSRRIRSGANSECSEAVSSSYMQHSTVAPSVVISDTGAGDE